MHSVVACPIIQTVVKDLVEENADRGLYPLHVVLHAPAQSAVFSTVALFTAQFNSVQNLCRVGFKENESQSRRCSCSHGTPAAAVRIQLDQL